MQGLTLGKGYIAYKLTNLLRSKGSTKGNGIVTSQTLSAVTKPPSVVAATATAYVASRYSGHKQLEDTLLKATCSAALAGLANAGLKRLIGRKRPRTNTGPAFKGATLDDSHNSMPSGHAAAVAAVAASIPKSSGPLLAAAAATADIGRSPTGRDAHHFSDVLVGSCVGFAAAQVVKRLAKPVTETVTEQVHKVEEKIHNR